MADAVSPTEEYALQPTLDRASTILGAAISVHTRMENSEAERVAGAGKSAACAYVATLPWGKQACRRSREKAGGAAVRRGKPVPFVCHMGFPCVAAPVGQGEAANVLTVGPYCPKEAPGSLEKDAIDGLEALNDHRKELPFSLEDIPLAPSEAPAELAAWAAETLTALTEASVDEVDAGVEQGSDERVRVPHYGRKGRSRPVRDPYQSADIAAVLSAGDQKRARMIVRGLLADTDSAKTWNLAVKRGRAIAIVAATIEAAERLRLDTTKTWSKFSGLSKAVTAATDSIELSNAVMKALGTLKASKKQNGDAQLGDLYALVIRNLIRGITLKEAAHALNLRPDALSKRIKRKLGMSFSDYVGRVRVDKAKESLRKTNRSVKDIARSVGLNDAGNFSKLFRRFEGSSPTQFRQRYGMKRNRNAARQTRDEP